MCWRRGGVLRLGEVLIWGGGGVLRRGWGWRWGREGVLRGGGEVLKGGVGRKEIFCLVVIISKGKQKPQVQPQL